MDTFDSITLTIEPKKQTIRMNISEKGIHSSKLIRYDDLMDCLHKSMPSKHISSGLLPPNCLSFSIGEDNQYSVALVFPERRVDFIYHDTTYANFPLPQLVFRFHLHLGHRIAQVDLGVISEGRITPQTKMFRYPFSNVSGYRLCTGVNALPKYDSLHGISTLPYLILSMPNNDDYFKAENNRQKMELRTLLEHLKDKDPSYYYSDVLIPNGQTISDFIK